MLEYKISLYRLMRQTDKIKKIVNTVDGWLTDQEGELLYNLAKRCTGRGVIVEIGSWKGKSTIWLAKGTQAGKKVKVYAIDPHTGSAETSNLGSKIWTFPEFKKNIKRAGVDKLIKPIIKTSAKAAAKFDKPVELIFIDGAHDYSSVKLDFDLWFPKIINGGWIVFHDSLGGYPDAYTGPKKVVDRFVYRSSSFKNIGFLESITYAQKTNAASFPNLIRNYYIFLLKRLMEITHSLSNRFTFPRRLAETWKKFLYFLQLDK